jgi:hypothetical protein
LRFQDYKSNDDFSGGEANFPELKKNINPKKDTALLFKNFNSRKKTLYTLFMQFYP